ncbi:hypothetical protein [Comamonas odontotermitis]|uniref:hypothetical protein n=1 Tax=Comamonas odontotermitis TaxID=379895 RepID=UPI003750A09F
MKKTEHEMLVLAAKAAGIRIDPIDAAHEPKDWAAWNPLADDGDALGLAVKLRLTVMVWSDGECASAAKTTPDGVPPSVAGGWQAESTRANGGLASATRRAIVQAAAEIGESMS